MCTCTRSTRLAKLREDRASSAPILLSGSNRAQSTHVLVQAKDVEVKLYKLLLYEKGGHFAFHQDTEKFDGMFATLIVQLPCSFTGGDYVIRNQGKETRFQLSKNCGSALKYVAHFADCEHSVEAVTSGHRLALVYALCAPKVC